MRCHSNNRIDPGAFALLIMSICPDKLKDGDEVAIGDSTPFQSREESEARENQGAGLKA